MYATKVTGAVLGLLALVFCLGSGAVSGGSKTTKLPPAKTPEEAIKNVLAACKAGDLNLLLEQIAEPVRTQMWALMQREVARDDARPERIRIAADNAMQGARRAATRASRSRRCASSTAASSPRPTDRGRRRGSSRAERARSSGASSRSGRSGAG